MLPGYNYSEIYCLFKKYANKIKYVDYKNIIKGIYGLLIKRKLIINGLNSGEIIEKTINEALNNKGIYNIKQIKMPVVVPSVDLNTGKIYCFSSKEVRRKVSNEIVYINDMNPGQAVRASCSYPIIFSPYTYNKAILIDGGLRENIPWKETKKIGAEKVISVIFEKELGDKCCDNILEVVNNSLDILMAELSDYEIEGADCLLEIKAGGIGLLDMKKIDKLYELGYKTAKRNMGKILKLIKE